MPRAFSLLRRLREFAVHLMTEGLTPGGAAAAVFIGVFIAFVPIYGLQSIAALALATVLRLNKPLTFGATFVNNPLLQPFLVVGSIEVGQLVVYGRWVALSPSAMASVSLQDHLASWLVGGIILGAAAGSASAMLAAGIVVWTAARVPRARLAGLRAAVARRLRGLPGQDRRFVQWKLRLDRLFQVLLEEDLGAGTVVDLGCGYGEVLALVAFRDGRREMHGCDLDPRRIAVAREAFADLNPRLEVADVRSFPLPPSGLILLIDVLQYLDAAEQSALLARCAAALEPGGLLIARVHDLDRGWLAGMTTAFDRLIFRVAGCRQRPVHLPVSAYRRLLADAGLTVRERRMRNLLPLAHVIFVCRKREATG